METPITNESIQGVWHVIGTTFPMWLAGDKLAPQFKYSNLNGNRFDDTVQYTDKNGKTHEIHGFDVEQGPGEYLWRGRGWLCFFTTKWRFVASADDWAVIVFEPTLVTPAGLDVISRRENMTKDEMEAILNRGSTIPAVAKFASNVQHLIR
jgi:hypothetical protein